MSYKIAKLFPKNSQSISALHKRVYQFSKEKVIKDKQKAIEKFLLDKHKREQSPQTVNLALNAVKFLYAEVLKNPQKINLKFAKRSKKLPVVLSRAEIERIIEATDNAKCKLMSLSGTLVPCVKMQYRKTLIHSLPTVD